MSGISPMRTNACTNVAELSGDAQVAGKGERETGTCGDAVHRGDHRLVHRPDRADRRGVVVAQDGAHVQAAVRRCGAQVLAAAETAAGAGDDHSANRHDRTRRRAAAAVTSSSNAGVIAFSTSGRLSVSVSTPSVIDCRSCGVLGAMLRRSSRRTLRRRRAEIVEALIGVDAGVVAVGPDRIQPIRAHQRDIRELVLARMQVRVGAEPAAKTRFAFARGAGAGAAEHRKRECGARRRQTTRSAATDASRRSRSAAAGDQVPRVRPG